MAHLSRPWAPAYDETPLLSVGKKLRVQRAPGRCQRAVLQCVDEGRGSAEVEFCGLGALGKTSQGADGAEEEEATVPVSSLQPLQPFELRSPDESRAMFSADIAEAVGKVKDEATVLFKLGDFDAAAEHYGVALQEIQRPETLSVGARVLVNRGGSLTRGTVQSLEPERKLADIATPGLASGLVRGVPLRTVCLISDDLAEMQTALYLNRARCLMQLGRNQEAAWDLSLVIGLLQPCEVHGGLLGSLVVKDASLKLVKAHFLRAKTRLARLRLDQAIADVHSARRLEPPEDVQRDLRALEDRIEVVRRQEAASNKKLRQEICKLADAAMSNLTSEQLASFGEVPPT